MKKKAKSMFRRPLDGELAQRLYVMPPLPPTTTTLAAFKSLLLDRLRLLRIAGKFHVDNVLGIPQELQQELNAEAAGASSADNTGTKGVSGTAKVHGNPFVLVATVDVCVTVLSFVAFAAFVQ